jgi:hypothetical protein
MARKKRPGPEQQAAPAGPGKEPPGEEPPEFAPMRITSHRGLAAGQREVFRRFNARPELSKLLLLNPVLAFKEVGVELSPEIRHHVLHAIEHPPRVLRRRKELEEKLTEAVGESPRPEDGEWLATFLFEKLDLEPLDTRGMSPAFHDPFLEPFVTRLQALRPPLRPNRYPPRRSGRGMAVRPPAARPLFQRLDLDAPLPPMKKARRRPKSVPIDRLYFYKDSHPLVRDLLELATIRRRAFPIQSPASYRRIKEGSKPNAFHAWVRSVHFPAGDDDEPDL